MFVEQEFIQRQIKQLAQVLARLLTGKVEERNVDAALDELDGSYDAILGLPRAMLDRVDEASLSMMLGRPDRLEAYVWLQEKEAELRAARGETAEAARLRARAHRVAVAGGLRTAGTAG